MELDAFDRKILTLLQRDSRMPQRDIGGAVHLSASAVNRRVAAMEAAGVITAYQAIVELRTANSASTVFLIDGVDLRELELDHLRARISLVGTPQTFSL